jgi:hypothetical protein
MKKKYLLRFFGLLFIVPVFILGCIEKKPDDTLDKKTLEFLKRASPAVLLIHNNPDDFPFEAMDLLNKAGKPFPGLNIFNLDQSKHHMLKKKFKMQLHCKMVLFEYGEVVKCYDSLPEIERLQDDFSILQRRSKKHN